MEEGGKRTTDACFESNRVPPCLELLLLCCPGPVNQHQHLGWAARFTEYYTQHLGWAARFTEYCTQ